MSRSRGKLHLACICPWCGTRTLIRDTFHTNIYRERGASFICNNCHTGFTLRDSPRVQFTNALYAAERRQRPPERPRPKALMYKIGELYPPGAIPVVSD